MRSFISFLVILSIILVACSGAGESIDEATLSPEPTTVLADKTTLEPTIVSEFIDTPAPTVLSTSTSRPTDDSSLEQDLLSYMTEIQAIDTQWWKTLTFGSQEVNFQHNIASMFGDSMAEYEVARAWLAVYTLRDLEASLDMAGDIEAPIQITDQHINYLEGMEALIDTLYRSIDEPDLSEEEYNEALIHAAQQMSVLEEELDLKPYEPDEDLLSSEEFNAFTEEWDEELYERLESNFYYQDLSDDNNIEPVNVWVTFSPEGEQIATAVSDDIYIWDANKGVKVNELTNLDEVIEGFDCSPMRFTPKGDGVLCSDFDGKLLIWNFEDGHKILDICADCSIGYPTINPDGSRLVIGARIDDENVALVIDLSTGERLLTLKDHTDPRPFASFSPDGKFLVTTTFRDPARIWNADNGNLLWALGDDPGNSTAFSPDGSLVVSGGTDGYAHIWDVESGNELLNVAAYVGGDDAVPTYGIDGSPIYEVSRVAFSPDGNRLVTADNDSNVRVWDVESGEMLFDSHVTRPGGTVTNLKKVVFSPSGHYILTQEQYGDSYIWDSESGEVVTNLGHVYSSDFSPDGHIVVGRDDGTATIWDIEMNEEILTLEIPYQQ